MYTRGALVAVGIVGVLTLLLFAVFSSVASEAQSADPTLDGAWAMVVATPSGIIRSNCI